MEHKHAPPLVPAFRTYISLYRKYTHNFSRKPQDAFNMWSKSAFARRQAQVKLRPFHFDVTIITALLFLDVVAQHDGYHLASCSVTVKGVSPGRKNYERCKQATFAIQK